MAVPWTLILRSGYPKVGKYVLKFVKIYAIAFGLNYIGFDINVIIGIIWPNGMGEQPLYTIEVWGESRGDVFHGRPLNMEYVP